MRQTNVLIVDDDADIRELISTTVRNLGFDAVAVDSADGFRAAYELNTPDIVVLDVVLPGESGLELLGWLATKNFRSRVVMISGLGALHDPTVTHVADENKLDVVTLSKPFSLRDLGAAISQVTDRPGAHNSRDNQASPYDADLPRSGAGGGRRGTTFDHHQTSWSRRNVRDRVRARAAEASWWGG